MTYENLSLLPRRLRADSQRGHNDCYLQAMGKRGWFRRPVLNWDVELHSSRVND